MSSRLVTALLAACVATVGCGDEGGTGGGAIDVARAYIEAIDEREGDRFCELVAPYISGRLDLELKNPDSDISGTPSCGEFISGFIGYIEDCCPPEFIGAEVTSAKLGERQGRLQAVDLRIELETKEQEVVSKKPLRDTVWLAEFDGQWRVAKLSAAAHAASLGFDIGDDDVDGEQEDPLAPPDLEAQLRAYEAEKARAARTAEEREASYAKPSRPAACEGLVIADPPGDARDYQQPAPDEPPPPTPYADLREVELATDGDEVCIRFTTAGDIHGEVSFRFNMRNSAAGDEFIQIFDAEVREDGLVRVTSGTDEERHPIPVPAEVGIQGSELTMSLTRESFQAGEPAPSTSATRPIGKFAFMASATARLSEHRVLHDDLGTAESPTPFSYPDGKPCGLGEC